MTGAAAPGGAPMWERFAHEYLIDGNGTQAAIRAGASPTSAHATASRWLKMDKVRAIIDKHKEAVHAQLVDQYKVTQERVLEEMARLALYDPKSYFNPDGSVKALGDLTVEQAAALTHVRATPIHDGDGKLVGMTYDYRLHAKEGPLTKLGMHLGMFKQRVVHEGDADNPLRAIVQKATAINKMLPSDRLKAMAGDGGEDGRDS